MPTPELLAELRDLLGEQGVLLGEQLSARVYDPQVGTVQAKVLVRPRSTTEVSGVLRLCHECGQPVVTHGGLTGLVFGGAAAEGDLILSLEALNRIESVDVAGRTMRVDAGVTLQQVQEEAERFDLMFPLDLGA